MQNEIEGTTRTFTVNGANRSWFISVIEGKASRRGEFTFVYVGNGKLVETIGKFPSRVAAKAEAQRLALSRDWFTPTA